MAKNATKELLTFSLSYFKDRVISIRADLIDKIEKTFRDTYPKQRIPTQLEALVPMIKSGEVELVKNRGRYWDLEDSFEFVGDGEKTRKAREEAQQALIDKVREESRKAMDLVILGDEDAFVKLQEFQAWVKTFEIKFE